MRLSGTKISFSHQKFGLILLSAGLFFFIIGLGFKIYQESRGTILSFAKAPEVKKELSEELFPTQISISKINLKLPVFKAKIENGNWEISEKGTSYLLGSGVPGQKGNVVIYGHNKNNLFGPIRWLEAEDRIEVINQKGERFSYVVVETKTVSPTEVKVLSPTEEPRLTLYTCTGFLDRQRFVVVAKLSS